MWATYKKTQNVCRLSNRYFENSSVPINTLIMLYNNIYKITLVMNVSNNYFSHYHFLRILQWIIIIN